MSDKPQASLRREFTLEGLDAFLAVMRKHGVVRFKTALDGSPLEAEFEGPPVPGGIANLDPTTDTCSCGHPVSDHNDTSECLRGCPADKCSP